MCCNGSELGVHSGRQIGRVYVVKVFNIADVLSGTRVVNLEVGVVVCESGGDIYSNRSDVLEGTEPHPIDKNGFVASGS